MDGTSVTDFVVRSAQKAAEQTIREHATLGLTGRESQAFVEALLAPVAPNAALRAAAKRYRRKITTS